jgi:hypothetical protein
MLQYRLDGGICVTAQLGFQYFQRITRPMERRKMHEFVSQCLSLSFWRHIPELSGDSQTEEVGFISDERRSLSIVLLRNISLNVTTPFVELEDIKATLPIQL